MKNQLVLLCFFCVVPFCSLLAQEVSVDYGKTEIGENETFQITATVKGDRLQKYSNFPDIPGFNKSSTTSSTSTNIINGQVSMSQSIVQNYVPTKQGTFTLPAFTMTINGKDVKKPGVTIKVGAPVQRRAWDPFADFWGREKEKSEEYIEVEEEAFFAVTPNKTEVYVGEGFNIDVSFYVSVRNRASMDFYKIGEQLNSILKTIKPTNSWEENFGIESINPEYVSVNGEQYKKYRIYQATFFPLNSNDIDIPSANLKMIKYKVAKNPGYFGRNRKEDFKTFSSRPRKIIVKELPPHPLKEMVNVGEYQLIESPLPKNLETGEAVKYEFKIEGKGNIASIKQPTIVPNEDFNFYPPAITQNVNRARSSIYGQKAFQYYLEPQEPGTYQLSDYIQWVYFNTRTATYDTLAPNAKFSVSGESLKNAYIASNNLGGFYDVLDRESNQLRTRQPATWSKYAGNFILILLLLGTVYLIFKK